MCRGKDDETRSKHDARQRQHSAPAMTIYRAADRRTGKGRDQQGTRHRRKNPGARDADADCNWIGENRWQIVARAPGERLCGPERRNDKAA